MVLHNVRVEGYEIPKGITIDVNSYWITIYRDGKEIFKMTPDNNEWYTGSHKKMCQGLSLLDEGIREIVNK